MNKQDFLTNKKKFRFIQNILLIQKNKLNKNVTIITKSRSYTSSVKNIHDLLFSDYIVLK